MRPSRLLGPIGSVMLLFGIIAGLFLAYSLLISEAALTPTPSLHVDIGTGTGTGSTANTTDNSYVEDPLIVVNAEFKDLNPDTIERTSGSWITDGFVAGGGINVSGTVNNNFFFTIATVTALVVTLDGAAVLTNEGPLNANFNDGSAADQLMTVPTPFTPCKRFNVTNFGDTSQTDIFTDIIIEDAQELVGADVRINFDPLLIQFVSATITPFTAAGDFITGWTGANVGLVNLPAPPYTTDQSGVHRDASPAFNDNNTDGAAFLAGTYDGTRLFEVSSESGPTTTTNTLPDSNFAHAPDVVTPESAPVASARARLL